MSTDSHDSGASHPGDLRAGHESVRKPPASSALSLPQASKLTESSFPTEKKRSKSGASSGGGEKVKTKKHKKHKHGHKHKSHKRHKSGESKEARTKYAVRSPVRAVEDLRSFTEDKEEAGDSSESDAEEHRDSGSEEEVRMDYINSYLPQHFLSCQSVANICVQNIFAIQAACFNANCSKFE